MLTDKYPIIPSDLDTTHEPNGFDVLLDHDQILILWAFIQFWQSRKNWKPFKLSEFIGFVRDPSSTVNESVKNGAMWFAEGRFLSLFDYNEDREQNQNSTFAPTHYLVSTYFHWNPAPHSFG